MTKIVDLQTYRTRAFEQKGFGPWQKRFSETFDLQTRLTDFSDQTLHYLAQPGELSSVAYYELIMGVLDLGAAPKFHYLENRDQMRVVDIHLFLADQVRFEMLRRLEWIERFEAENFSLFELVRDFDRIAARCREKPPELAPSHPDYAIYTPLTAGDKEVFVRRLLQPALDTFKERL